MVKQKKCGNYLYYHRTMARWIGENIEIIYVVPVLILTLLSIKYTKIAFWSLLCYIFLGAIVIIISIIKAKNEKCINYLKERIEKTIQNLWLLNFKVINVEDWKKIKCDSIKNYLWLTSSRSKSSSFYLTLYIVETLKKEDLKILWIKSYGYFNAVIKKDGYIYDPELKRTYKKERYLEEKKIQKRQYIPIESSATTEDEKMVAYVNLYKKFNES